MHIEKQQPDMIVEAIRDGIVNISRAKAEEGQKILLAPTGWKPGDDLVTVKVIRIESTVIITQTDQGETWGLWL